jgi:hypothetical protein
MNPGAIWGLFLFIICIFGEKLVYYMKVDLHKSRVTEKKGKVIEYKEVRDFNKQHPDYNLKKTDIIKIMRTFNSNMADETMNNIYGVVLPENIGVIFINNAGKPSRKPIDYAKSKALGQTVYHKNWDTDNNLMRIVFMNKTLRTVVKNTKLFGFNAMQQYKKKAAKYFKKNWSKCLAVKYNSRLVINP